MYDWVPKGQEDQIGRVKFANFSEFAAAYPDYQYVFVGDSGQADALTAQLLVTSKLEEGTSRVLTTFIHLLRTPDNVRQASHSFNKLPPDLLVSEASSTGRGVIVFRNYIRAAVLAYKHRATLDNLITAEELATITEAALAQFQEEAREIAAAPRDTLRREVQGGLRRG